MKLIRHTAISTQLIGATVAVKSVCATATMYFILAFKPKNHIVPMASEYGVPGLCSENAKASILVELLVREEALRIEHRG